jgi:hypothetical protein
MVKSDHTVCLKFVFLAALASWLCRQTIAVTALHVTLLQYSVTFLVLFGVFDYFFWTVIVTGINYIIFDVFTPIIRYFLR